MQQACKLLDVSHRASLDELKKSYRKMAKQYHPDTRAGTADPEMFHRIVSAYNTIVTERQNGGGANGDGFFIGAKETLFSILKIRRAHHERPVPNGSGARHSSHRAARSPNLYQLTMRLDGAPEVSARIEAARLIFMLHLESFERLAIKRLARVDGQMRVELIRMLGRLGTTRALRAIAPFLTDGGKPVRFAAYMALERSGPAGQALIDDTFQTKGGLWRRLGDTFNKTELDRRILKTPAISWRRLRRLKAFTRHAGIPMRDLLERIGVFLPGSA